MTIYSEFGQTFHLWARIHGNYRRPIPSFFGWKLNYNLSALFLIAFAEEELHPTQREEELLAGAENCATVKPVLDNADIVFPVVSHEKGEEAQHTWKLYSF